MLYVRLKSRKRRRDAEDWAWEDKVARQGTRVSPIARLFRNAESKPNISDQIGFRLGPQFFDSGYA